MLENFFFFFFLSLLLSLLSHLHYTPIGLGWIKSAIKTSIHVSVKDMRHINSTQNEQFSIQGWIFDHTYLFALLFCCVHIMVCMFAYTCIHAIVHVKEAAAGKTGEMC